MAIDTARKRLSLTSIMLPFFIPGIIPDGVIDEFDKQVIGWGYSGIDVTAGEPTSLDEVICGDGQVTLKATPAVDPAYDETQVLYRRREDSVWTIGITFTGTQGVQGSFIQGGLQNNFIYNFILITKKTSGDAFLIPSSESWCFVTAGLVSEESIWLDNLITILANSSTFHTMIGATGTTAQKVVLAKARIFKVKEPEGTVLKPFILVDWLGDQVSEKIAEPGTYLTETDLFYMVIDDLDSGKPEDADTDHKSFSDDTGLIREDIKVLSGTDDFLNIKSVGFGEVKGRFTSDDENQKEICTFYRVFAGI